MAHEEKIYSKDEIQSIKLNVSTIKAEDAILDWRRGLPYRQFFINGVLFAPQKAGEQFTVEEVKSALKKQTGVNDDNLIDALFLELSAGGFVVYGAHQEVLKNLQSAEKSPKEIEPRVNIAVSLDEKNHPQFIIDYYQTSFAEDLDDFRRRYLGVIEEFLAYPDKELDAKQLKKEMGKEYLAEVLRIKELINKGKKEEAFKFIHQELEKSVVIVKEKCRFSLDGNGRVKKEIESFSYVISKRLQELYAAKLAEYRQKILEHLENIFSGNEEYKFDFAVCCQLIKDILELHAVTNFLVDLDLHNLLIDFARIIQLEAKDRDTFDQLQALLKKYRPFDVKRINENSRLPKERPPQWNYPNLDLIESGDIPALLTSHKLGDNTHRNDFKRASIILSNLGKRIVVDKKFSNELRKKGINLTAGLSAYLMQNVNQESIDAFCGFDFHLIYAGENFDYFFMRYFGTAEDHDDREAILHYLSDNHIQLELVFVKKSVSGEVLFKGKVILDIKDHSPQGQSEVKNIDVELIDFVYTQNNLEIAELVYKQKENKLTNEDISRIKEILRAYPSFNAINNNPIVALLAFEFGENGRVRFFGAQVLCQTKEGQEELKNMLGVKHQPSRSSKHLFNYLLKNNALSLEECAEVVGMMGEVKPSIAAENMRRLVRHAVVAKPEGYQEFLDERQDTLKEVVEKQPWFFQRKRHIAHKAAIDYEKKQVERAEPLQIASHRAKVGGGSSLKVMQNLSSLLEDYDLGMYGSISSDVQDALHKHAQITKNLDAQNKEAESLIIKVFKWLKGVGGEFVEGIKTTFGYSSPSIST